MSERSVLPPVLLALTVVTGVVDAVSYLALGRVFTANMTGNAVLLGFAAVGAPGLSVTRSATALAGFVLGAIVGGRMAGWMSRGPWHRWTGAALGFEAVLFTVATTIALGNEIGLENMPARLYSVITLIGVAMGHRSATIRKLAVRDLTTTTVLTMTLAGLVADSFLAGGQNTGWSRRAASVGTMVAGAASGAWLVTYSIAWPLAFCAVVSAGCAAAVYIDRAGRVSPSA